MRDEFIKAMFEDNPHLGGEHYEIWQDGAEHAYKWIMNKSKQFSGKGLDKTIDDLVLELIKSVDEQSKSNIMEKIK